jgi:hypothetical protein
MYRVSHKSEAVAELLFGRKRKTVRRETLLKIMFPILSVRIVHGAALTTASLVKRYSDVVTLTSQRKRMSL